jgi:hypothetical protein
MDFIVTHCKVIDNIIFYVLSRLFVDHLDNDLERGKFANIRKGRTRKFPAFLLLQAKYYQVMAQLQALDELYQDVEAEANPNDVIPVHEYNVPDEEASPYEAASANDDNETDEEASLKMKNTIENEEPFETADSSSYIGNLR